MRGGTAGPLPTYIPEFPSHRNKRLWLSYMSGPRTRKLFLGHCFRYRQGSHSRGLWRHFISIMSVLWIRRTIALDIRGALTKWICFHVDQSSPQRPWELFKQERALSGSVEWKLMHIPSNCNGTTQYICWFNNRIWPLFIDEIMAFCSISNSLSLIWYHHLLLWRTRCP